MIFNVQHEFPYISKITFLNHAAISPCPFSTKDIINHYLETILNSGPDYYWGKSKIEETRNLVASLINAHSSEIAFVSNTSSGISKVAMGLSFRRGDRILCVTPDFPSNIYPWIYLKDSGVEVDYFDTNLKPFSIRSFKMALRSRTRLVTLSHVNYINGLKLPLEEIGQICRARGVLLFVDAIQSLGHVPVDTKAMNIDFLSSGTHKWLMGLPGVGILYVSKGVQDMLRPTELGWKSVVHEEEFTKIALNLKPDAAVLEPGTMNLPGLLALNNSVKILCHIGIHNIFSKVLNWNKELFEYLETLDINVVSQVNNEWSSGILSFQVNDAEKLYNLLSSQNIKVSIRAGLIRVSPHFYNTNLDQTKLLDAIRQFL